jgi:hypothetical protein
MVTLDSERLLRVWEESALLSPARRSLLLVQRFAPKQEERVEDLAVGERDWRLLLLRKDWFGDTVEGITQCPQCQTKVELDFSISSLPAPARSIATQTTCVGDYRVQWRLPSAGDLADLTDNRDVSGVRDGLLQRCLIEVKQGESLVDSLHCPERVVQQVGADMAAVDPLADSRVHLRCPECQFQWLASFDIGSFLSREVDNWARKLLREVHVLAVAYGWSEQSILAMSTARRNRYLEMLDS